jgi:hypothetical protein
MRVRAKRHAEWAICPAALPTLGNTENGHATFNVVGPHPFSSISARCLIHGAADLGVSASSAGAREHRRSRNHLSNLKGK